MDETTYSDPDLIALINRHFVPIRVDADQYPHVHDHYIAGGWPTNAFLSTTGEVLWAGTYIAPEQFGAVAESVRQAWTERRAELAAEIERRRKALEAARGRTSAFGIVRRETADDVWASLLQSFDAQNGGFGTAPKYPTPAAIELLFVRSREENGTAVGIASHTLDGMLAGQMWDAQASGFFRYALGEDWTKPQTEKLLAVNAELLRAYTMGACVLGRAEWRTVAEQIVGYVNGTLLREHGLWAASQSAAPEYYGAAQRAELAAPAIDEVLYTSANAQWIRALAEVGARLQQPAWVTQAERALGNLHDSMAAPNGLYFHYRNPDVEPQVPYLLLDACEMARAFVSVAQATGNAALLDQARRTMAAIEKAFWADEGGFYDRTRNTDDVGVLRYRDRPFDSNAEVARLLIDLALCLGERSYRALAERTLVLLSPSAGRYSVGGSGFALAVHEFFDPPTQVFVVGSGREAAALRAAAFALPLPSLRVWPLPNGGRVGPQNFPLRAPAAAYVLGPRGVSPAITDPAAFADAAAHVGS